MRNFVPVLLLGFILALVPGTVLLEENTLSKTTECQKLMTAGASSEEFARRGCCSHHGGVCGCSGGRAVCCDGALSPSCGCRAPEPSSPN